MSTPTTGETIQMQPRPQQGMSIVSPMVKRGGSPSYFRKQAFAAPIMQSLLAPLQDANSPPMPPSNKAVAILKAL
ncbi:MAG: hypothetical protein Q9212_003279 [Teloschistes hypoglaucus]